jgi:hypothetical protein
MMLGLATACIRLADPNFTLEGSRLSGKLIGRIFKASVIFLVLLYVFVELSLR